MFYNDSNVFGANKPAGAKVDYAKGFKAAASELYAVAADMLEHEGHDEAARNFARVSESLQTKTRAGCTPHDAMRIMTKKVSVGTPFGDVLLCLMSLTSPQKRASHPGPVRRYGADNACNNG
ncbi:MAG: hypothetical protein PHS57_05630 [Alphaproteobacteria bacterium]|nr:hypothetical protein [Alphaproteobacteria bacterium]